jgi:hypothetical protein
LKSSLPLLPSLALPMPVPRAVIRVTISGWTAAFVAGLLHVQDLAAQRQDGLELAVAALLGGAAGGVTLDDVDLAQRRVFSWQSASLPGRPMPSSTPLRRVISRALRAASRARAASTILPQMILASLGFSSR